MNSILQKVTVTPVPGPAWYGSLDRYLAVDLVGNHGNMAVSWWLQLLQYFGIIDLKVREIGHVCLLCLHDCAVHTNGVMALPFERAVGHWWPGVFGNHLTVVTPNKTNLNQKDDIMEKQPLGGDTGPSVLIELNIGQC